MRVSTGISNLDIVMDGGFIEKSFNLVYGGSGTGKTLFTFNYLLNGAERGKKVLYISLEESWDDLISKLPSGLKERYLKVKDNFHYLDFGSLRTILGKEVMKSDVLIEAILSSIVVHKISLVGVDSISPLSIYYEDERMIRNIIFELSQSLKSYGVTSVFTSEEVSKGSRYGVEEFVADSVIRLTYDGEFRRIQVLKLRGSHFQGGIHGFEIDSSGIFVYPRTIPHEVRMSVEAESLGIPKLDAMLGEIYSGDITLISGPPGTGKHMFGLQFLRSACASGKKGAYITFEPDLAKLKLRISSFNESTKNCRVYHIDVRNEDLYKVMWKIKDVADGVSRLVIQGMNLAAERDAYNDFVHSLIEYLRDTGKSTMVTYTTPGIIATNTIGDPHITTLSDNIIKLLFAEINGELKKVLVIIKSHLPTHERGLVEYRIGRRGIVIVGKIEELEGIMSGTPTKQMEIKKRLEKFFK